MSKSATERKAEAMTESVQSAVLTALVEYADEAIGNTANREGDAYQQGVRDIAAALAGLPVMPDKLGIGSLAGALEGFDFRLLSEYATAALPESSGPVRGRGSDGAMNIEEALQRIAQLEAELASRPAKRAARKLAGEACQYCSDTKSVKIQFLGLPLCSDWKPCASRQRRAVTAGKEIGYAWDRRYTVRQELGTWVARFEGRIIADGLDRGQVRLDAYKHRQAA